MSIKSMGIVLATTMGIMVWVFGSILNSISNF